MSGSRLTLKSKLSPDQVATEPIETSFAEVVGLIEQARQRAYQAVNSEFVGLYWRIGEYISAKLPKQQPSANPESLVRKLTSHKTKALQVWPGAYW